MLGCGVIGIGLLIGGCTKQEATQIETGLSPLIACEVNELLGGAVVDPLLLITGCAGATAQSLLNIGIALLDDATGTIVSDAGVPLARTVSKLSDTQITHLQTALSNLQAYIVDGGK